MLAGRLNILLLLLHSTSCRPWHFQHRLQHRYLRPARVGAERTTTDEDDAAFELLMATTLSEVLFTPNAAVDNSTVATPPPVDVEKAVSRAMRRHYSGVLSSNERRARFSRSVIGASVMRRCGSSSSRASKLGEIVDRGACCNDNDTYDHARV